MDELCRAQIWAPAGRERGVHPIAARPGTRRGRVRTRRPKPAIEMGSPNCSQHAAHPSLPAAEPHAELLGVTIHMARGLTSACS